MNGLVLNRYNLLLGAGTSRDVKNRWGKNLPTGNGLAEIMISEFHLSVRENEKTDLRRIYRRAGDRQTMAGQTRDDWLQSEFTQTTPPDWYSLLRSARWRTIWTLNIDDAVERELGRDGKSINFMDAFSETADGVFPIVHLHGLAKRPDQGLIFSLQEYHDYVRSPRSWSLRFQEILSDQPFVILGAALHHEFDLVRALSERALSAGGQEPSVAVLPNPSDLDLEDFASWNIHVFSGTAEEFLQAIRDDLPAATERLTSQLLKDPSSSPALVHFLEQWRPIASERKARWHDYLGGDEPEYSDASSGNVITRASEARVHSNLTAGVPTLLAGRPFSGKTSLALNVSGRLIRDGWKVYSFEGDSRIDVNAVITRIRTEPTTVLIIEQANEFLASLLDLAEKCLELGLTLRLLVIDREGPASRLRNTEVFNEVELSDSLTDAEILSMFELLSRKSRLTGRWARQKNPRVSELRAVGAGTMSGVVSVLVLGERFEERVRRDYRAIDDEPTRRLALLGAICSRVGKGVSVGLASAALNISGRAIEELVESNSMADSIIRLHEGRLRLRHRLYADLLTNQVVIHRELYEIALSLCEALAPQLSPSAVLEQTWAYRMSGYILDQERLAGLIGRESLEEFYAAIEDAYAWNSRYWEQRALAASADRENDVAVRFAKMALDRRRDAFTLNTLATVRLRALQDSLSKMSNERVNAEFWDCTSLLREARDEARIDSEHPFVSWFHNAVIYAKWYVQINGYLSAALRREWTEWWDLAERSAAFRGRNGARQLKQIQHRWLMASTTFQAGDGD